MTILSIIAGLLAFIVVFILIGALSWTWYANKIEEDERKDENYEEY